MAKRKAAELVKMKSKSKKGTKSKLKGKTKVPYQQSVFGSKPNSSHGPSSEAGPVEDEDILHTNNSDYLRKTVSERSYELLTKIRAPEKDRGPRKRRQLNNRSEDAQTHRIEESYIQDAGGESVSKRKRLMLPIKTSKGLVTREIDYIEKSDSEQDDEKTTEDLGELGENGENENSEEEVEVFENATTEIDTSKPVSTAELLACRQEVLNERKYRIGILCSGILENPEQRVKNFKPLLELMEETNPEVKITVRKLTTVSLLEVFKDILPSYFIRSIDTGSAMLKKETLKLRQFEQDLLRHYKSYLTKLEKLISSLKRKRGDRRKRPQQEVQLAEIAVQCMADLLVTHPYFNFSINIAQCLVILLDNHSINARSIAREAIMKVFKEDKRGELSLEIMRRINALVKKREHNVQAEALEVLLALRIKHVNLDKEKEEEVKQRTLKSKKMNLLSKSRKERKRDKKLKDLENELQEAKAEENKQKKHQHLTEIVKIAFAIYFRILKREPNCRLLSVALEGLAKFAHCINIEYYQDLVNVLDNLMQSGDLGYREQLHIVQTVFTILSGHGEMLNIDPCRFYTHLYRNLLKIHAGKSHSDMLIVSRALEVMLIKRRKSVTQQRILAFTKRLATLALQLSHNGSLSCLGHIKNVLQLHKSADVLLDVDHSGGQGLYDPFLENPEYCNAGNSALWEVSLLNRHYHPLVRKFSAFVSMGAPATGPGSLALDLAKLTSEDLFVDYDGSSMAFKPSIPPPKKVEPKQRPSKSFVSNVSLDEGVKKIMSSSLESGNFYKAFNC